MVLIPLLFHSLQHRIQVQSPYPLSMVFVLLLVLQLVSSYREEVMVTVRWAELGTAGIELK